MSRLNFLYRRPAQQAHGHPQPIPQKQKKISPDPSPRRLLSMGGNQATPRSVADPAAEEIKGPKVCREKQIHVTRRPTDRLFSFVPFLLFLVRALIPVTSV